MQWKVLLLLSLIIIFGGCAQKEIGSQTETLNEEPGTPEAAGLKSGYVVAKYAATSPEKNVRMTPNESITVYCDSPTVITESVKTVCPENTRAITSIRTTPSDSITVAWNSIIGLGAEQMFDFHTGRLTDNYRLADFEFIGSDYLGTVPWDNFPALPYGHNSIIKKVEIPYDDLTAEICNSFGYDDMELAIGLEPRGVYCIKFNTDWDWSVSWEENENYPEEFDDGAAKMMVINIVNAERVQVNSPTGTRASSEVSTHAVTFQYELLGPQNTPRAIDKSDPGAKVPMAIEEKRLADIEIKKIEPTKKQSTSKLPLKDSK